MITADNYYQEISKVHFADMPPTMEKGHNLVDRITQHGSSWETYHSNSNIKRIIDQYITKLNEYASGGRKAETEPPVVSEKSKPAAKVPKAKAEKKTHQEVQPTTPTAQPVERLDEAVKFIKRFIALEGKVKTDKQIMAFIDALQKAILEKRIRKTSAFAKEISHIQESLVSAYNEMIESHTYEARLPIEKKTLERMKEIAGSEVPMLSIAFIKRYVSMDGRKAVKEKVKHLYDQISKAIEKGKIIASDKYFEQLQAVQGGLFSYLHTARPGALRIEKVALNGLLTAIGELNEHTLDGCCLNAPGRHSDGVMSVNDAKHAYFDLIGLQDEWLMLIGQACKPTHFFIYGIGGSGKTSWVLLFCQYLASKGYKILYVAGEQFGTPTFKDLLTRLNIVAGDNFKIVDSLDRLNPSSFDFVVLDSKDNVGVELHGFRELKKKYQKQSFIILSQATKAGNFTGSEKWRNEVDVMLHADNGIIKSGLDKNRWGGKGEMRVF